MNENPDPVTPDRAELLDEMTREHKLIARHAREVEAAVTANRQREAAAALETLYTVLVDHFAAEEALMMALGYDGLDAHRADHDGLRTGIDAIRRTLEFETLRQLSGGLADYVNMAAQHIAEHDEPLRLFIAGEATEP